MALRTRNLAPTNAGFVILIFGRNYPDGREVLRGLPRFPIVGNGGRVNGSSGTVSRSACLTELTAAEYGLPLSEIDSGDSWFTTYRTSHPKCSSSRFSLVFLPPADSARLLIALNCSVTLATTLLNATSSCSMPEGSHEVSMTILQSCSASTPKSDAPG